MGAAENHRSTQRVIDILSRIAENSERGLSLTELAERLDAPKSSLFPIIHTLCENHLITFHPHTSKYTMGHKTYELGAAYLIGGSINASVREQMERVTGQCRETCFLGQLDQGDVFYLFKTDSPEPIRMVEQGKKLPAYSSAIGKALLSELPPESLRALYPQGLRPLTAHTVTDFSVLEKQLEAIRIQGIAFEKEESTAYIQCIAVPLRKGGKITAALSVAVPVFRYSPEKEALIIGLLKQAQMQIELLISPPEWQSF